MRSSAAAAAIALALACVRVRAADVSVGPDISLRWDTTVSWTSDFRVEGESAQLLADVNADDGDRAFGPGLVSSRFGILSEVEARYGDWGARLSADGWYDPAYLGRTNDRSVATFNPVSVPVDEIPRDTRRLLGLDGEVLDAFVRGDVPLGDERLGVRIGQFALLWGESLFLADNGIAAGLAPVDAIKALAIPDTPARELYLPVPQISVSYQFGAGLTLESFYQPFWRPTRLPGAVSYFSDADFLEAGGERLFLASGRPVPRAPDARPDDAAFGVSLRWSGDGASLGLYALRYDAKLPDLSVRADAYRLVYPSGIGLVGVSFSTFVGAATVAGEISARHDMPLASITPERPGAAWSAPARGDTLHAQLSAQSDFGASRFWNDFDAAVEIGANQRLSITADPASFDRSRTRLGGEGRGVLQWTYFQVRPGLDLLPSLGLGGGLFGRSSLAETEPFGAGDVTASLAAVYHTRWRATLAVTHFFGDAEHQPLGDRDFVSLALTRSF